MDTTTMTREEKITALAEGFGLCAEEAAAMLIDMGMIDDDENEGN